MKNNQNIYTPTTCSQCSFVENCCGRTGLIASMERRECVPAFMVFSEREVHTNFKEDGSMKKQRLKKKKTPRKRGRAKKRT